jgi:hypothetical protein
MRIKEDLKKEVFFRGDTIIILERIKNDVNGNGRHKAIIINGDNIPYTTVVKSCLNTSQIADEIKTELNKMEV